MEEPNKMNIPMRLEAAARILGEVTVSGRDNMIRLVSVMKELEGMAGYLRDQENKVAE